MSEATVFLVAAHFFLTGKLYEGLCVLLAYDLYARESDWETINVQGVHVVRGTEPGNCVFVCLRRHIDRRRTSRMQ